MASIFDDPPHPVPVRPELLRAAKWRAARYGLEAELIDVEKGESVAATEMVERLLVRLRGALEEDESWEEISGLVRVVLRRGNGAARQRAVFARGGNLEEVVDYMVAETVGVE